MVGAEWVVFAGSPKTDLELSPAQRRVSSASSAHVKVSPAQTSTAVSTPYMSEGNGRLVFQYGYWSPIVFPCPTQATVWSSRSPQAW